MRRLNRDGRVATLFTAPEKAGPTGAAARPLLVPAPGSPIAVASGEALVAGNVNGDAFADLVLMAGKSLKIFFGGANRAWPKEPDVSVDLAAGVEPEQHLQRPLDLVGVLVVLVDHQLARYKYL